MNRGVTLLKELQSSVSLLIEEADISFDDLKCNSRFLIHLFDKIPDYRSSDKGNIIFNNLGKITFTSFGYSSLNSSSFPFIL